MYPVSGLRRSEMPGRWRQWRGAYFALEGSPQRRCDRVLAPGPAWRVLALDAGRGAAIRGHLCRFGHRARREGGARGGPGRCQARPASGPAAGGARRPLRPAEAWGAHPAVSRLVAFATELGVTLYPGQAAILADFEGGGFSTAVWQCGRRAGKSLLADVLA